MLDRNEALGRGIRLEVLTIAWMAGEAVLGIGAGVAARSVLLTAFGLDSLIELLSGVVVLRRLQRRTGEMAATRFSAILLVLLCMYVLASSIAGLLFRLVPEASLLGMGVSAAAIVAMPLLARAKRRVNQVLESPSLRADIAETVSCAYLAGITLVGLAVSGLTGWWWVQYVTALLLLGWLVPEAREAVEEWRHNGPNNGGKG